MTNIQLFLSDTQFLLFIIIFKRQNYIVRSNENDTFLKRAINKTHFLCFIYFRNIMYKTFVFCNNKRK